MALSIYDIQRLKETNYEKGIVETFIRNSDLMKVVPFETVNTMQVSTRRMNSLPAVTWRQRGQRFSDGGQPGWEVVTDSLYNLGAEVNLDDADMRDKGPFITNPVKFNTEAKVKAIAYEFQDMVLNGDQAVNADRPEGIKTRIANLASSQTLYANSSTTELDVRPGTVTATTAYAWLNAIEGAKRALDGNGGGNVVCLTDYDAIAALKNSLRVIGQNVNSPGTPTTSMGERETSNNPPSNNTYFEWDGVKYIDLGVKADQSTKIVATDTVNSVACRPMYFVKLGDPYFHIIQYGPMEVTEPKLLDDMVTYRGVISWYLGNRHVHNRFGSVLKGQRVA